MSLFNIWKAWKNGNSQSLGLPKVASLLVSQPKLCYQVKLVSLTFSSPVISLFPKVSSVCLTSRLPLGLPEEA